MGSDLQIGRATEPPRRMPRTRSRPYRFIAEFETEIRQMYAKMLDDPVPSRLLDVLRAALAPKV